jgi:glycosyltransferase involved in cell wall biosynthesis
MVEPLLGDDVEVRGECDQEQKADLLGRAAALVFPIQWPEPFGLVMTEAMACGTPVVAWRNGSVPEVVADEETGFIVESMDELVAAIGRVGDLDPHLLRAPGRGAVLGRGHGGRLRARLPAGTRQWRWSEAGPWHMRSRAR